MGIGNRVRVARVKKNMRQEDLAKIMGKDRSVISLIERDKMKLSVEMLEKIAQALDMPVSYFYEPEEMSDTNDELTDRVIKRLVKRGYMIVPKKQEVSIPEELVEIVKTFEKDDRFLRFCKSAKKLSDYPDLMPDIARMIDNVIEHINNAQKKAESGEKA